MSLIRITLGAVAATAIALPVAAADFPHFKGYQDPPMFKPSIHDWTGGYAGVHAGWTRGEFDTSGTLGVSNAFGAFTDPFNPGFRDSGFIGGILTGYGAQVDDLYFGLEADLSIMSLSGHQYINFDAPEADPGFEINPETVIAGIAARQDWLATFRGRFGYTFDNVLLYATGGIAATRLKQSILALDRKKYEYGWVAGAGAEFAMDTGWSVRAEYLYHDFGRRTYSTAEFQGDNLVTAQGNVRFNQHVVRAALNYHFP